MKKIVFVMSFTFILFACSPFPSNSMPEEMPDDFDFSLKYGVGKKDQIDTFAGVVQKDLVENGTAEADIAFTDEEMISIYEKMQEINVLEKKKFTSKCQSEPREEAEWKITLNGETVTHSIEEFCNPTGDTKAFFALQNDIIDIVQTKEAYRELPEIEGGYD